MSPGPATDKGEFVRRPGPETAPFPSPRVGREGPCPLNAGPVCVGLLDLGKHMGVT